MSTAIFETVDTIARCYPILDVATINGINVKFLINFDHIYRWIADLGYGSYGAVRCYQEIATGNRYAFKEIPITEHTNVRILQDEVSSLRSLSQLSALNNAIVKYKDSFIYIRAPRPTPPRSKKSISGMHTCCTSQSHDEIPTLHYVIAMDYISGCTLHHYINVLIDQDKIAQSGTVYSLGIWLLTTLAAIHDAGYAHRDIKPENIMFDFERQRFTLLDFGLTCSKHGTEPGRVRRISGTPEYMAPELWTIARKGDSSIRTRSLRSGALSFQKKADIWSAGVTLYCLLEQHLPWTPNMESVPDPERFSYWSECPDLVACVRFLLCENPHSRPSAGDAADFWKRQHRCRPTTSPIPTAVPNSSMPPRELNASSLTLCSSYSESDEDDETQVPPLELAASSVPESPPTTPRTKAKKISPRSELLASLFRRFA